MKINVNRVSVGALMDKSTKTNSLLSEFQTLVEIVARLRGPDGCPWDKEQTQKSLTQYVIEEAFELVEAIEKNDPQEIIEELGDFLFQVILQAQVAQDEGQFSLLEVIKILNEKMLRRHPHVFGPAPGATLNEVWKTWDKIKAEEKLKKKVEGAKSIFNHPKSLPALQAAFKIGGKTKRLQFDWQTPEQVLAKVDEEISELKAEMASAAPLEKLEHELGDVLFSVAQLARHLDLEPEQCLRTANQRFETRFSEVVRLSGKSLEEFVALPEELKETLWQQAKENLDPDRRPKS